MSAYRPPSPADLRDLKALLGLTGRQLAELFDLAGDQQWRKYTGGAEPRTMGLPALFFAAARIELQPAAIERVLQRMRAWGAVVDLAPESLDVAAARAAADASDAAGIEWWNGLNEGQRRAALDAAQRAAGPGAAKVSVAGVWRYFGRKAPGVASASETSSYDTSSSAA